MGLDDNFGKVLLWKDCIFPCLGAIKFDKAVLALGRGAPFGSSGLV